MLSIRFVNFVHPLSEVIISHGSVNTFRTFSSQLYLALNDIEHTRTRARSFQANCICERFHKIILQEFYQVTFRKKVYSDVVALQHDLYECHNYYNNERTHQGKMCCGLTPIDILTDGKKSGRKCLSIKLDLTGALS